MVEYMRSKAANVTLAASMAINQVTTRNAIPMSAKLMMEQINFPKGYLTSGDRLQITKRSKPTDLEAVVTGRKRTTSLGRFAKNGAFGRAGMTVEVIPGQPQYLKHAWLVKLPQGNSAVTEDRYNVGVAVRLKPGTTLDKTKKTEHKSWLIKGKVALLYGPSVDQVFRAAADNVSGDVLRHLEAEFLRQFRRIT